MNSETFPPIIHLKTLFYIVYSFVLPLVFFLLTFDIKNVFVKQYIGKFYHREEKRNEKNPP